MCHKRLEFSGGEFFMSFWQRQKKSCTNAMHVKPMAFCDLSGADREKIKHVLTECTVAKLFCREIKLLMCTKLPSLHPHSSASDVLITGMYSLWTQRNKCRHREN